MKKKKENYLFSSNRFWEYVWVIFSIQATSLITDLAWIPHFLDIDKWDWQIGFFIFSLICSYLIIEEKI